MADFSNSKPSLFSWKPKGTSATDQKIEAVPKYNAYKEIS